MRLSWFHYFTQIYSELERNILNSLNAQPIKVRREWTIDTPEYWRSR